MTPSSGETREYTNRTCTHQSISTLWAITAGVADGSTRPPGRCGHSYSLLRCFRSICMAFTFSRWWDGPICRGMVARFSHQSQPPNRRLLEISEEKLHEHVPEFEHHLARFQCTAAISMKVKNYCSGSVVWCRSRRNFSQRTVSVLTVHLNALGLVLQSAIFKLLFQPINLACVGAAMFSRAVSFLAVHQKGSCDRPAKR
jgi:hypothetical protein